MCTKKSGAKSALGGAYPGASVLARSDRVPSHKDSVQKVVDALVAAMHWINKHSAAQITPPSCPRRSYRTSWSPRPTT
ncbi:hypothetical protein [Streptomyces sp. NBC_01197]|nr:hypothetical protein OG452_03390 [Streptomyces sp. NBC_01197]